MPGFIDMVGQRFGRLLILQRGETVGKNIKWICQCDCGKQTQVFRQSLISKAQVSCGCYMRELSREAIIERSTTHNMSKSPEYSVWCGMKRRCENRNERCFGRYGAIGVSVDFASFEEFFAEVGERPSKRHSIDRIDPHGNYASGNVRWLENSRQNRNKKTTLIVTAFDRIAPLADFCDELGLKYHAVWSRIKKLGWSANKALTHQTDRIAKGQRQFSAAHKAKTTGGLFDRGLE